MAGVVARPGRGFAAWPLEYEIRPGPDLPPVLRTLRTLLPALALTALVAAASGSVATPPIQRAEPACCTATIRVRVPEGTGAVYLAGNLPQLGSWRADALRLAGTGRDRTVRVTAPAGTLFEYKFTLGSWDREALLSRLTAPCDTSAWL